MLRARSRNPAANPENRRVAAGRQGKGFPHAQVRAKRKFLMYHGNAEFARRKRVGCVDRFSVQMDFTLVSDIHARKNFAQGALSGAILATSA